MATPRKTAVPRKTAAPRGEMIETPPVIADVSSFKKAPTPVQLPSGNWVVIRRVGLRAFLVNGVIPNSLMAIVQTALTEGVSSLDEEAMMKEMMDQPEKLADLMAMVDAAAVYSMVNPKVYRVPTEDDEDQDRDESLLYADELDEADKMAIFTYATGGTIELEQFRP